MFTKFIRIISVAVLLSILAGCATSLAIGNNNRSSSKNKIKTYLMSDEIVAIAHPKQREPQDNNQPNGLVMIGLSNSYHITHGAEFIEKLIALDATAISINENQDIEFDVIGTRFSGVISVDYMKEHYTFQELSSLNALGFSSHTKKIGDKFYDAYSVKISLAGNIYSKYQGSEVSLLTKGRKVKFSTVRYEKAFNGKLLFDLPFSIAFDVVTAPIQAILLVGVVASAKPHAR